MKLRSVFLILIIVYYLVGAGWAVIYLVDSGEESFHNQIEDYLVSVISSNNERIDDVISEVEEDVLFLSESEKVKDIFKKEVLESEAAAKIDVDGKVSVVARIVENFIKANPEMTLEELRGDNEFRRIATQKVGETGYAVLLDAESTLTYVHVDPKVEGTVIIGSGRSANGVEDILEEAVGNGVGSGFYDWEDIDGKMRRKYMELRRIETKTADGVALLSGTTAYVDDYLVVEDVSSDLVDYFAEFDAIRGYHNILFVSKDNRIIYMAGTEDGLGSNLKNVRSGFGDLSSLVDVLGNGDVGFYGPFIGHGADISTQFAVASRVYDGEEFLGTIAVIEDMAHMDDILGEGKHLQSGEGDEDYLVDRDGLLITPIRSRDVDIMVQEIKTANVEECLGDFGEARKRGISVEEYDILEKEEGTEELFLSFLNFNGDLTFGLHRPIGRVDWCLLSEVSAEAILREPMEMSFKRQIYFRAWMFVVMVVLMIVASLFIGKEYVLKRKATKKRPCGVKGVHRPLYCRLMGGKCGTYPNGRCGRVIRTRGFFVNLNLGYYLLFAVIFAAAYLFVVTSFFQGLQNAKLFDDILDMLVFVVGFMIFVVGLKMSNMKAKHYIIYGGLLICLRRLFDIPFQEWQVIAGHLLTPYLWVPVLIVEYTGFLLLLIGYRRLKNV